MLDRHGYGKVEWKPVPRMIPLPNGPKIHIIGQAPR